MTLIRRSIPDALTIAARRGRRRGPSGVRALTAALILAALGSCSQPAAPTAAGPLQPATPPTRSAIALAESCTEPVPKGTRQLQAPVGQHTTINTAVVGSGPAVAVLLHQTNGNGLCGFLFYADYLARHRVKVVLIDLCGYGQSICDDPQVSSEPVRQVQAVTDMARAEGATRIVVVGASMGGTAAVHVGAAVEADAVVDLSGPAEFNGMAIADDGRQLTMPALFAYSDWDSGDRAAVRRQLGAMPTHEKTLLNYSAGHGYDLLHEQDSTTPTRLAKRILHLVRGS